MSDRSKFTVIQGGKQAGQDDADPGASTQEQRAPSFVDGLEYNDVGNAQRLVSEHGKNLAYVSGVRKWLYWSEEDGVWKWDNDGRIVRLAIATLDLLKERARMLDTKDPDGAEKLRKFVSSHKSAPKIEAMIKLATSMEGVSCSLTDFDSKPHNLRGLVLKRNPGVEVREPKREDRCTMVLGAEYNAGARSKVWDRFLRRVQPNPAILRRLQMLTGYSLYGKNHERLMVVLFGPTTTGKSQFIMAVDGAFGQYSKYTNLSVLRDNQDERPRADIVRIFRSRLVWAEEASGAWHIHPDQIKRMAGATQLAARLPHDKDYLDGEPSFTFWLLSNHPPSIEGADDAVWKRMQVVPFNVRIPDSEIDVDLPDRLSTTRAREAILAWAIEGWNMYVNEKMAGRDPFRITPELAGSLEDFKSGVSDVDAFAAEALVFGSEMSEEIERLYSAYSLWASREGAKPITKNAFSRFLTGRGTAIRVGKVKGASTRFRDGVCLNEAWSRIAGADA